MVKGKKIQKYTLQANGHGLELLFDIKITKTPRQNRINNGGGDKKRNISKERITIKCQNIIC